MKNTTKIKFLKIYFTIKLTKTKIVKINIKILKIKKNLIYRFQIKSYKIGSDRIRSGSDSDQIRIKFNMIRSDLERIKIFLKKSDRIGFDLNPIRSDPCGTLPVILISV